MCMNCLVYSICFFLYYAVLHFSVDEPVSYHLIVASVLLPTVSVLQAPASSL